MKSLSRIRLFATPWIAAHQAPLSMGFSRQEDWSGLLLPFYFKVSKCGFNFLSLPWYSILVDQELVSCLNFGILSILQFFSEKAIAPHSSTLAWKIPLSEEPGRLQYKGSLRVRHD